jgi:hypothetical protein
MKCDPTVNNTYRKKRHRNYIEGIVFWWEDRCINKLKYNST